LSKVRSLELSFVVTSIIYANDTRVLPRERSQKILLYLFRIESIPVKTKHVNNALSSLK
jgi:hypothetical protein